MDDGDSSEKSEDADQLLGRVRIAEQENKDWRVAQTRPGQGGGHGQDSVRCKDERRLRCLALGLKMRKPPDKVMKVVGVCDVMTAKGYG